LQLKDGQILEDFILEVEKVNEMIGESTLNQYKAYKSIVKHKKRVNRVFSEQKISDVVVAVCSASPPKAPRRELQRGKG
jgi:uncharacterized protein YktA (UPF0223 family)